MFRPDSPTRYYTNSSDAVDPALLAPAIIEHQSNSSISHESVYISSSEDARRVISYADSETSYQYRAQVVAPSFARFRAAVRKVVLPQRIQVNPGRLRGRSESLGAEGTYKRIQAPCIVYILNYASPGTLQGRFTDSEFLSWLSVQRSSGESSAKARWIHIQGVSRDVMQSLATQYELPQPFLQTGIDIGSRIDQFDKQTFLAIQCHSLAQASVSSLRPLKATMGKIKALMTSQDTFQRVNVFVIPWFIYIGRDGTVISTTSLEAEILQPFSERLRQQSSVRNATAPFLFVEIILHCVIDRTAAVLEAYKSNLLRFDLQIGAKPNSNKLLEQLQVATGDARQFQQSLNPLRILVTNLYRSPQSFTSQAVKPEADFSEVFNKMEALHSSLDTVIQDLETLIGFSQNSIREMTSGFGDLFKLRNRSRQSINQLRWVSKSANSSQTAFNIFAALPVPGDIYTNLYNLLMSISPTKGRDKVERLKAAIEEAADDMRNLDYIQKLAHSQSYRLRLLRTISELGHTNDVLLREALQNDEMNICDLLKNVLSSPSDKKLVLQLEGDDAQAMLDLIQSILDKGFLSNPNDISFARQAHRLLVRLSEASEILPSSLTITGITLLEKDAAFGGGFADIYRGMYQGEQVAIKRMRIFQRDNERHRVHRMIAQEALIWQKLKHSYVLPFLGIDSETFPQFFCLVSPWMMHGTIMRFLAENGGINVEQMVLEVAQGLDYLHAQGIIHGDLRGGNILIDSEWHVRLSDFGLTVLADGTVASHTSNAGGSTRWMAPELFDPESFGFDRFQRTRASDMYAFGCTCFEIYTRVPPFADVRRDSAVLLKVLAGSRPEQPLPEVLPLNIWSVIEWSWKQNPDDRPTAKEVVHRLKVGSQ